MSENLSELASEPDPWEQGVQAANRSPLPTAQPDDPRTLSTLLAMGSAGTAIGDKAVEGVEHMLDWAKAPGNLLKAKQPTAGQTWSDADEARAQLDKAGAVKWGEQTAMSTVFDPVPQIMTRMAQAGTGAYALRNMRLTPVAHDPFSPTAGGHGGETALGVFAGPNAKTANMAKLDRAKGMLEQGAPPDRIWQETGWFQGADGKWRFEISDQGAKFVQREEYTGYRKPMSPPYRLKEVLDHPELYKAYPDMENIWTRYTSVSKTGEHLAAQSPTRPSTERIVVPASDFVFPDSARSTALHESQHAIQAREGFASGGDPRDIGKQMGKELENNPELKQQILANPALAKKYEDAVYETYMSLAGETEARNVQTRKDFTRQKREAWEPRLTEDRPREQQIVRGVRMTPVDHNPFK